jgi:hypothetical protein
MVMSVCPSICLSSMIQLENCWTDFDEIWYGCHAIEDYPKIALLNFIQPVIPIWRTNKLVRLGLQ